MAVGRIPPTTSEIYVPERPLGQVYLEIYELLWIGEEARTAAFHQHCEENEKHFSQLLGVSAVSNSNMRLVVLVKS